MKKQIALALLMVIAFQLVLLAIIYKAQKDVNQTQKACSDFAQLDNEILSTTGDYIADLKFEQLLAYMENIRPIRQQKLDYCINK